MHKNGNNKTIHNFRSKTSWKCSFGRLRIKLENNSTIKITEIKTGDRWLELAQDSFIAQICVGSLESEPCSHSMTEVINSDLVFDNYHRENGTLMKRKYIFVTGHIITTIYHNLSQIHVGLDIK